MIKIVKTTDKDFKEQLQATLHRGETQGEKVEAIVKSIIADVKRDKDKALTDAVAKFDGWNPTSGAELAVNEADMKAAYDALEPKLKEALHTAYDRIAAYHKELKPKSWITTEANGTILGQKVTPVDRAGLYIPGGKAVYPSSLLMNAIPAIVAGVQEIAVCTPTPGGEPNPLLMAAAHLCGIKKMYKIGGLLDDD